MPAHLESTLESTVRKGDQLVLRAGEKQTMCRVKNANLCSLEPGRLLRMGSVGALEEPEPKLCPWKESQGVI